ncbi:hypothetical protein LSH36_338g07036 [Paralvinella palmiformis]|uniref:Uncharacterized protein n=1 Tax=Paralvinella palmiformis TaxID=53620 RepID=A0AAD9JGU8_9ANNE|nr:hypothetical protein LSH36_338g07036 [Paralvinella palmiformis]
MFLFLIVCWLAFTRSEVQILMQYQGLTAVPTNGIPNDVTNLDLSYNNITELPDLVFGNYTSLQILDLRGNLIEDISTTAFANTNIAHLYLIENRLKQFPDLCSINRSLTILELVGNDIRSVSEENVTCLSELVLLELTDNKIATFPSFGNASASLSSLYIRNNGIKVIEPDRLSGLTALRRLFLEYNLLAAVPDFSQLPDPGLTVLRLSGNPLARIPSDLFGSLPNLEDLSMTNLELDAYELPKFDPQSMSIRSVDFGGNVFVNFSESVLRDLASAMPHLTKLSFRDIIGPNLPHLDKAFSNHTLSVDASYNRFECTCSLSWMVAPSDNIISINLAMTKCTEDSRPALINKLIMYLTEADMCPAVLSSMWNSYRAKNAADSDIRTCAITGFDRKHWLMVELKRKVNIAGVNLSLLSG